MPNSSGKLYPTDWFWRGTGEATETQCGKGSSHDDLVPLEGSPKPLFSPLTT